jgi:hypothetical protein
MTKGITTSAPAFEVTKDLHAVHGISKPRDHTRLLDREPRLSLHDPEEDFPRNLVRKIALNSVRSSRQQVIDGDAAGRNAIEHNRDTLPGCIVCLRMVTRRPGLEADLDPAVDQVDDPIIR